VNWIEECNRPESVLRKSGPKGCATRLFKIINPEAGHGRNMAAPVLRFVVNGGHGYLIFLTDGYGNGWNVPVAPKDLEVLRDPQSKSVVVALK
jgi:hypothetical protein